MIIVFQTYKRTEYALKTIESVVNKVNARWLIVDDGSDSSHLAQIVTAIGEDNIISVFSQRVGYGRLANWAWAESIKHDPITLWLEDDWILRKHFNLTHYEKLLSANDQIGMIRLAHVVVGLHGEIIGDGVEAYLRLHKGKSQCYFAGNPALRHRRFYDAYGLYPEGLQPGDTELAYDRKIQNMDGPDIVIPFEIGTWGAFGHIGAEKSY